MIRLIFMLVLMGLFSLFLYSMTSNGGLSVTIGCGVGFLVGAFVPV